MAKSLLSSFTDDFNAVIEVKQSTSGKNSIGEKTATFNTIATGIKCLLLRNSQKPYDMFAGNMVEFVKTSHKARLEKGVVIKEGDVIEDANAVEYEVKFVELSPGFGGEPDHMLLFIDRIKNEGSKTGGS